MHTCRWVSVVCCVCVIVRLGAGGLGQGPGVVVAVAVSGVRNEKLRRRGDVDVWSSHLSGRLGVPTHPQLLSHRRSFCPTLNTH